ncbi:hypothetical protein [Bacillus alveayuensis]|uniref:DUF3329 domain-containing protein n=1 Tax=Aeribacillus alveayuensis TaxID=279215 RepID=A0ABT9VMN0_9BACI|nr:hypothetical protein [Bacillus alveayuensis]MDQ0162238.1 hypothetical protein [Bacillus alveayuensis]
MAVFLKKHLVLILCILAFASPIIGNLLIDVYYYSSLVGWIVGFIFIISSYIIVSKRPDEPDGDENMT